MSMFTNGFLVALGVMAAMLVVRFSPQILAAAAFLAGLLALAALSLVCAPFVGAWYLLAWTFNIGPCSKTPASGTQEGQQ